MAYSYKCSISFGLIYIPVTLHASVKTQDVGFNMLDKKTMSRVKYKKTCEECDGREVKQEDIVDARAAARGARASVGEMGAGAGSGKRWRGIKTCIVGAA